MDLSNPRKVRIRALKTKFEAHCSGPNDRYVFFFKIIFAIVMSLFVLILFIT